MADSDFLSYSSVYETFSKGPKSIYYGVGDEMLPGVILNVPQTDEDDEWGRTQRITDERTYDFIAKIYKTLFDPYNSLADISLVPGEAGSEINVAKNMIRLVGRTGIDTGVFDLSVPSMTLGDIVVDGSSNSILIGSGYEATETTLKLNTFFEFDGGTQQGSLTYKNVTTNWHDYSGTIKFTIVVDGKEYFYGVEPGSGDPMLELPVGGVLHVQGTSKVNAILPNANEAYNIGSASLRFANVYTKYAFASESTTDKIYTSFIYPTAVGGTVEIGNLGYTDILNVRAKTFKLFNVDNAIASMEIYLSGSYNLINIGDAAGSHVVNIKTSDNGTGIGDGGFNVYTASAPTTPGLSVTNTTVSFNKDVMFNNGAHFGAGSVLTTRNVLPDAANTYEIGSMDFKFNRFYTRHAYSHFGLYSEGSTQWYLCGPNLRIKNSETSTNIMHIDDDQIDTRVILNTRDLRPDTTNDYDIGTEALEYHSLYTRYAHTRYGLFSDATTSWTICGPNMKILVNGDSKIGVCAAYIEMYEPLYSRSIYPIESTGVYLGHSTGGGFEALFLRDQATGVPKRVYVSSGALLVS